MSGPRLPSENIGSILDLLFDDPQALKQFCLVSKSLVDRARKHLFNHVMFEGPQSLNKWEKNFLDHKNSPAVHTRSLCFPHAEAFTKEDLSLIRLFTEVVRLEVRVSQEGFGGHEREDPLVPFHGLLSPQVKFLCVGWNRLELCKVLDFVCSLPSLEDLRVVGPCRGRVGGEDEDISDYSHLSRLTGTLVLEHQYTSLSRKISELPNCLRFQKIVWKEGFEMNPKAVRDLVEKCSETLKSIHIRCRSLIDFSRAKKLTAAEFWFKGTCAVKVAETLRTITSEHKDFKQVSIHLPPVSHSEISKLDQGVIVREEDRPQWEELDSVLFQLRKSHQVHVNVICHGNEGVVDEDIERLLKFLFPMMRMEVKAKKDLNCLTPKWVMWTDNHI